MKKSWKKASAIFMAAALAGVMTVSMSATAFAADDDGYILKATNEDSKSSDNDLVIAIEGSVSSMDPANIPDTNAISATRGVYETLVSFDENQKLTVPNAIRAFNEVLRPKGITHCGIRFDSGDIAYLTKKARKMLDDAGWPDCKITVSNALDERLIAGLLRQGAQIDSFGVGERLITARSEPVFGGVYKLAAIEDKNGNIIPKIKISENVGKITNPHFKKVYRFYSKDSGMAEADYICLHDEVVDDTQPLEICDPDATWKKKVLTDFTARELLVPIFRDGRLVYQKPALDDIRAYCAQQLTTLWPEVLRFDYPHNYYVDLSEKLLKIKLELLNAGGKSQG